MDYVEVDVTYDTINCTLKFLCPGKFDPSVLTLESVVL